LLLCELELALHLLVVVVKELAGGLRGSFWLGVTLGKVFADRTALGLIIVTALLPSVIVHGLTDANAVTEFRIVFQISRICWCCGG
jgi:hypothetical protein